jgi:hypothetical protein
MKGLEMSETKLKRGMPSEDELLYIASNAERLTPEQIAANMRRSITFVKERIAQLPKRQQLSEQSDSISQLHASPLWEELKRMLMPNECSQFEHMWASYIKQFSSGSDILASDEMMIKDLIILDIFGGRAAAEIRSAKALIDQLQKMLDKEREKSIEVRDQTSMQSWQEQINGVRGSLKSLTEAHLSYQERKDQKLKQLKATREARFKEIIESRQNIFGLLRELDDVRNRVREGKLMEKVRLAAEKVRQDWNQLTTYEDDTVDKPFLSPEGELEDERIQAAAEQAGEQ